MSIGEKIRALREEAGLTQGELGRALHMTQRKISYLENDRFEPNLQDLREICLFFSVSSDFLLGLSPPAAEKNSAL